jgi:hypothetical protein
MNARTTTTSLILAACTAALTAQGPLTPGNLVVVSVNDGTTASAVTLNEYTYTAAPTPAVTLVQSITLPTSPSGSNRQFTIRGDAASEGYLGVSQSGTHLLLAGYDAPTGTSSSSINSSLATAFNRVVATVTLSGTIDTSTALTDAYNGAAGSNGNIRAAASLDGFSGFWVSGTGTGSSAGVRYVGGVGASTSTLLNTGAPSNCRVVGIYDGQLYTSSASTVYLGVCTVGTGVPTTNGQVVTLLPGFPTGGGTSAGSTYDYFWADQNTVYVADDNSPASTIGGISKWTFNGSMWSRAYRWTVNPTATSNWGARGVTGFTRNGVTTVWATMNDNTAGSQTTNLVSVVDTGAAAVVNVLATAPTGTAFRGLRYLAKPTTAVRFPAACGGSADYKLTGNAELGTDVRTTVTTPAAIPLIVYGTLHLGVPVDLLSCTCVLGPSLDLLVASPVSILSIPNNIALLGVTLYTQGIDFLAGGVCNNPVPAALTDYYSFTIQ